MNHDALTAMIKERIARIGALRAEIDGINREINVLQEAVARGKNASGSSTVRAPRDGRRERALKPMWRDVLRFVASDGDVGIDDVMAWAELHGHPVKRSTVRSQMAIYADRGWVQRRSSGRYCLTDQGKIKCGLESKTPDAEPSGVAVADEVGASSIESQIGNPPSD